MPVFLNFPNKSVYHLHISDQVRLFQVCRTKQDIFKIVLLIKGTENINVWLLISLDQEMKRAFSHKKILILQQNEGSLQLFSLPEKNTKLYWK